MSSQDFAQVKNYALKLLSLRPRSVAEIRQKISTYLSKKKLPGEFLDRAIKELSDLNYLNDREFALWWLDQRGKANIKGRYFIKQELIQKGIDRETIEDVLSGLDSGEELSKAVSLARKKLGKAPKLDRPRELNIKRYLQGRGFSFDTIAKVIDSLSNKS